MLFNECSMCCITINFILFYSPFHKWLDLKTFKCDIFLDIQISSWPKKYLLILASPLSNLKGIHEVQ
jgi:hypothetical protein